MADIPQSYRLSAIKMLTAVVKDGRSLSDLIRSRQQSLEAREAARLQELTYGTVRWSYRLDAVVAQLLKKPLRNKDSDVRVLLWQALYEIIYMRTPDYAVVSSYATLTNKLRKGWAKALVNASLREFLRSRDQLLEQADTVPAARHSVPEWLYQRVSADWPQATEQYFAASNQKAPLVLRVNTQQTTRDAYLKQLQQAGIEASLPALGSHAIAIASGVRVETLPDFAEGHFAVQDSAAQLAAELVAPRAGERVLDACAAPGGKTAHLASLQPDIHLTAIDNDSGRLQRVEENLRRLRHSGVQTHCADAAELDSWWNKQPFDAILLDAPCSALGVMRRHPDIRRLRRDADIDALFDTQFGLLKSLWQTLAPGGRLIYVTCSVLRRENEQVIAAFLADQSDAVETPIEAAEDAGKEANWGLNCEHGRQILPGQHDSDGFYYAILARQ